MVFGLKKDEDSGRYWKTKKGGAIWLMDVIQWSLIIPAILGVIYLMTAFMATMIGLGNKVGF